MPKAVDLEGFDELHQVLAEFPHLAQEKFHGVMERGLLVVLGIVREYPPVPDRMRSGSLNTYMRGQGSYPPEAFIGPGGEVLNDPRPGFKHDGSSERLGTRWSFDIIEGGEGALLGVAGNSASYADEVQGFHQKPYHRRTGWVTLSEALERAEPGIMEDFGKAADELVQELGE